MCVCCDCALNPTPQLALGILPRTPPVPSTPPPRHPPTHTLTHTHTQAHARVDLDSPANDINAHPTTSYPPSHRCLARLEALTGATPLAVVDKGAQGAWDGVVALYAARDAAGATPDASQQQAGSSTAGGSVGDKKRSRALSGEGTGEEAGTGGGAGATAGTAGGKDGSKEGGKDEKMWVLRVAAACGSIYSGTCAASLSMVCLGTQFSYVHHAHSQMPGCGSRLCACHNVCHSWSRQHTCGSVCVVRCVQVLGARDGVRPRGQSQD